MSSSVKKTASKKNWFENLFKHKNRDPLTGNFINPRNTDLPAPVIAQEEVNRDVVVQVAEVVHARAPEDSEVEDDATIGGGSGADTVANVSKDASTVPAVNNKRVDRKNANVQKNYRGSSLEEELENVRCPALRDDVSEYDDSDDDMAEKSSPTDVRSPAAKTERHPKDGVDEEREWDNDFDVDDKRKIVSTDGDCSASNAKDQETNPNAHSENKNSAMYITKPSDDSDAAIILSTTENTSAKLSVVLPGNKNQQTSGTSSKDGKVQTEQFSTVSQTTESSHKLEDDQKSVGRVDVAIVFSGFVIEAPKTSNESGTPLPENSSFLEQQTNVAHEVTTPETNLDDAMDLPMETENTTDGLEESEMSKQQLLNVSNTTNTIVNSDSTTCMLTEIAALSEAVTAESSEHQCDNETILSGSQNAQDQSVSSSSHVKESRKYAEEAMEVDTVPTGMIVEQAEVSSDIKEAFSEERDILEKLAHTPPFDMDSKLNSDASMESSMESVTASPKMCDETVKNDLESRTPIIEEFVFHGEEMDVSPAVPEPELNSQVAEEILSKAGRVQTEMIAETLMNDARTNSTLSDKRAMLDQVIASESDDTKPNIGLVAETNIPVEDETFTTEATAEKSKDNDEKEKTASSEQAPDQQVSISSPIVAPEEHENNLRETPNENAPAPTEQEAELLEQQLKTDDEFFGGPDVDVLKAAFNEIAQRSTLEQESNSSLSDYEALENHGFSRIGTPMETRPVSPEPDHEPPTMNRNEPGCSSWYDGNTRRSTRTRRFNTFYSAYDVPALPGSRRSEENDTAQLNVHSPPAKKMKTSEKGKKDVDEIGKKMIHKETPKKAMHRWGTRSQTYSPDSDVGEMMDTDEVTIMSFQIDPPTAWVTAYGKGLHNLTIDSSGMSMDYNPMMSMDHEKVLRNNDKKVPKKTYQKFTLEKRKEKQMTRRSTTAEELMEGLAPKTNWKGSGDRLYTDKEAAKFNKALADSLKRLRVKLVRRGPVDYEGPLHLLDNEHGNAIIRRNARVKKMVEGIKEQEKDKKNNQNDQPEE